jgi:hypothetical protein
MPSVLALSAALSARDVARLLWVERQARTLSRWSWGVPVVGAVYESTLQTWFDPARALFVLSGWVDPQRDATARAWAQIDGARPTLTQARFARYRSRHRDRPYSAYAAEGLSYVPHRPSTGASWQPRAEAGRLTTEGTSLEDALRPWLEYGLVTELRARDRAAGRLCLPRRDERLSLSTLGSRRLVHALTGVRSGDDEELLGRLHSIARWGGVLAGSERRARGVVVTSLSPRGDHAAGIDRGVACTLASRPSVRSECWFSLRPELLQQRSWWAAPRDYGWEADPWAHYHRYNSERLGKRHLYGEGDRRGAERHLKATARSDRPNELYLPHSVCIEDIDTVYVPSRLYGAAWRVMETLPEAYRPRVVGDLVAPFSSS